MLEMELLGKQLFEKFGEEDFPCNVSVLYCHQNYPEVIRELEAWNIIKSKFHQWGQEEWQSTEHLTVTKQFIEKMKAQ